MTALGDITSRRLVRCWPDASLRDVAEQMVDEHVHAVFVIDEAGEPVGVVSDLDLLAGEWLGADDRGLAAMRSMTAAEIMTSPVETVDSQADVRDVARRLRELGIHRLLVVDAGVPVGVVSISDLVAELARTASVEPRTVGDVMSSAFVTCGPEASAAATARAMTERRSPAVVVMDRACEPLGLVTGFDLVAALEGEDDVGGRPVGELMSVPLHTIGPGRSLRAAADLMLEHEVHRLLVVQDGTSRPIGILSTADIVVEMARPGSRWERGELPA